MIKPNEPLIKKEREQSLLRITICNIRKDEGRIDSTNESAIGVWGSTFAIIGVVTSNLTIWTIASTLAVTFSCDNDSLTIGSTLSSEPKSWIQP